MHTLTHKVIHDVPRRPLTPRILHKQRINFLVWTPSLCTPHAQKQGGLRPKRGLPGLTIPQNVYNFSPHWLSAPFLENQGKSGGFAHMAHTPKIQHLKDLLQTSWCQTPQATPMSQSCFGCTRGTSAVWSRWFQTCG